LAKKVRESSETTLVQEVAQLKGQLAEFEGRVEREHAECNKAKEETEQYKNQINRLVSQRFVSISLGLCLLESYSKLQYL
jgi:molecular chaperone GrpE (heat shock protein)